MDLVVTHIPRRLTTDPLAATSSEGPSVLLERLPSAVCGGDRHR
jgi:hypothetical protein